MKKVILLLLLVSANLSICQVDYSHYLDATSEWRYYAVGFTAVNSYSDYSTTYFDGNSIINGLVYRQEYVNSVRVTHWWSGTTISETTLSGPKYVREDNTGKFYRINSNTNQEDVFFDNQEIIDAQIGQTFPYPGAACSVESIETNYLGVTPLKRIKGSVIGINTGSLEGVGIIGSICGVGVEGGGYVNCYTKQGFDLMFGTIDCNAFPVPVRVNLSVSGDKLAGNKFFVYPNPTEGLFELVGQSQYKLKYFEIYDTLGLLIKKGNTKLGEEINISDLANGIYLLKVDSDLIRIIKNK